MQPVKHFSWAAQLLLTLPLLAQCQIPFLSEYIAAAGLLGSHFGVPDIPATFDYVIVGGGTAGLTLARRLAANPAYTVAVIEAGGFYEFDNGNFSSIPAFASQWTEPTTGLAKNPLVDWYDYVTPQPGLGGRTPLYTQGKTFGGGSARNFMNYQRPSTGSLQKWADEVGDQSYTWRNMLPYFKKSVTFNVPLLKRPQNISLDFDLRQFNIFGGGPLQVSFPRHINPISTWFGQAFESLGFGKLPAFSDGRLFGWSYFTYTVDPITQTRSSSETAFMREALRQTTNLNFYKTTLAKKITFDKKKKATGVLVETAGRQYTISAKREVILSAGAFRSPQLLMVSGIGPASKLSSLSIPVLADRPGVGQNMWDNCFSGPAYPVTVQTHNSFGNPAVIGAAIGEYKTKLSGIMTNGGGDFLAFEKLPKGCISSSTRKDLDKTFGSDWPDVEYLELDAWYGDALQPPPADSIGKNFAALLPGLTAPFSRGNVTITSNDTADNPVVSPNWLEDPRDREVLIAAFKRARQVFNSRSMRGAIRGAETWPGKDVTSDEGILDAIKRSAQTIWHASATCKMGKKNDRTAVVDSQAKVIGVKGLRVVDASTFPFLPPGQPQSVVYALAEKIADRILQGK